MRTRRLSTAAALAALVLSLAACARNDAEEAQDSARADSAGLAPPVGSFKDAADSAVSAGTAAIEGLQDSGVSAKEGMDSAAARGVASSANDTGRPIPGQTQMRPRPGATTGPGSKRP